VKPGAAHTVHAVRALGRVWLCGCSLALAVSCTTSETDSIDLTAPSAKPKPKEPMKPMADMMPMPCMNDEDAGCPKQPMSPPKPPPP